MKIKLLDIYHAQQSLAKLVHIELPIGLAFRVARLTRQLESEYTLINEKRNETIKKFGKLSDPTTGQYQIEDMQGFNREFGELMNQEIEISGFDSPLVFPDSVWESEKISLTPADMILLDKFVKMPYDNETVETVTIETEKE